MTGRPREFDRNTAIQGAMETFWRHGYEATSVQDLVAATGINRGSMYDTFGSKRELFIEALAHYSESSGARVMETLRSPDHSPLENLRRLFDNAAEMLTSDEVCPGCLLTNTAVELAQHDPEIAAIMKKKFTDLEKAFRQTLERAVDAGELPSTAPLAKLAGFLLSTLHGTVVSAKAGASRKTLRDNISVALSAITGETP